MDGFMLRPEVDGRRLCMHKDLMAHRGVMSVAEHSFF